MSISKFELMNLESTIKGLSELKEALNVLDVAPKYKDCLTTAIYQLSIIYDKRKETESK